MEILQQSQNLNSTRYKSYVRTFEFEDTDEEPDDDDEADDPGKSTDEEAANIF